MNDDGDENFLINEMQLAIANIAENEAELEADEIVRAIDSLLGAVHHFANVLQVRYDDVIAQQRPTKAAQTKPTAKKPVPPKPSKAKPPQKPSANKAAATSKKPDKGDDVGLRGKSRIGQGINQAQAMTPTLPRVQSLRQQIYGATSDENALAQAAKRLAS